MSPQEQFDRTYISSSEVCTQLDIARATILQGIKTGKLPEPIIVRRANSDVAHIVLFLRSVAEPMIEAWAKDIAARRAS